MTRPLAYAFRAIGLVLLALMLFAPQTFAPLLRRFTENDAPAVYEQTSILSLTLAHLGLVGVSSLLGAILAVGMGIFVTRPSGREFLPLSRSIANIGQTFPPVAVLALAVPAVGFGARPALIALTLYGLLPIFENTLAGIGQVRPTVLDAARGMGLTARQRLWRVELPLALPVMLAGLRLSVVINLGTATIASTVGAKSLGEIIIAGLNSNNTAFVLQGGLVVALLAILVYDAFGSVERAANRRFGAGQ